MLLNLFPAIKTKLFLLASQISDFGPQCWAAFDTTNYANDDDAIVFHGGNVSKVPPESSQGCFELVSCVKDEVIADAVIERLWPHQIQFWWLIVFQLDFLPLSHI